MGFATRIDIPSFKPTAQLIHHAIIQASRVVDSEYGSDQPHEALYSWY
jgi:hypothetical protein